MKKITSIIAALFTCYCINAQSIESARNQIQNENFIKAKQELLSLAKTDNSSRISLYLGNVYLNLDDMDSAKFYYQKASANGDALGHIAKARVSMMSNGDTTATKADIEKAISMTKGRDAEIYFQAGYIMYQPKAKYPKTFVKYFQEAARLDANNSYYKLVLGDACIEVAKLRDAESGMWGGKAMSSYEEVLSRHPYDVLANIRQGRLMYAAGNYNDAIKFLRIADSLDPKVAIVHKELAEIYYRTKRYNMAIDEYRKYISLNDNDTRIKVVYSGFLLGMKDYNKTIEEVSGFLATDSTNYIYYRILAYASYELQKYDEAQMYMNKMWKYMGNNKVIGQDYSYAGRIAGALGDTANAVKNLRLAVQTDTADAELKSELGKTLYNTRRYAEAVEVLKKRIAMPNALPSPYDYYYMGIAYYSMKDYKNADSAFAGYVQLQQTVPDGYYWRGKCHEEMEGAELKGAGIPFYQKFIELGSSDLGRYKSRLSNAYQYMGFVALTNKDNAKAKEYLTKALEYNPGNKFLEEELKKLK